MFSQTFVKLINKKEKRRLIIKHIFSSVHACREGWYENKSFVLGTKQNISVFMDGSSEINYVICSFYLDVIGQKVVEISSVNEVHNYLIICSSWNYFPTSWKQITTQNNKSWKCWILKQIIILIVFNNIKM